MHAHTSVEILIIEDEKIQADTIQRFVESEFPNFKITVAYSKDDALGALTAFNYTLILTDIMLQNTLVFDILEKIQIKNTPIIFISAYDRWRTEAFQHYGIDYILKPMDTNRLKKSIEVALSRSSASIENSELYKTIYKDLQAGEITHIALPSAQSHKIIEVSTIQAVEAERSYCVVHLSNGERILLSKSLAWMEEKLNRWGFIRTHRSWLVNPKHIIEFIKSNNTEIRLTTGLLIAVSENMKSQVRDIIKKFTLME